MKFIKSSFFGGLPFALIGGILFCYISLPVLIQSSESGQWPSTIATIENCWVDTNRGDDGNLNQLIFEASYEVDGRIYTTNQRYLDNEISQSWVGKLDNFAYEHPKGSTIEIFYNPDNPKQATTQTGFMWRYGLTSAFFLIFLIVGLGLMFSSVKKFKREPEDEGFLQLDENLEEDDKSMGIERY